MIKFFHIAAGLLSIGAGAVALYALKGARLHRRSGMIFVGAMMFMSISGALLAALKAERLNTMMGLLTFYLVTTALLTVRRRGQSLHWVDAGAMLVALAVGVYEITLGFEALNSPKGRVDGMPAAPCFVFGALALLAGLGDLRMLLVRGLQGAHRIARHLWRMCAAMFIATGSLFLGQPQVFPKPIRIMPVLAMPVLIVVVLLFYWLARVLFTKRYRHA